MSENRGRGGRADSSPSLAGEGKAKVSVAVQALDRDAAVGVKAPETFELEVADWTLSIHSSSASSFFLHLFLDATAFLDVLCKCIVR